MSGVKARAANTGTTKASVRRKPTTPAKQAVKLLEVLEWRPDPEGGEPLPYLVADRIIESIRHNSTAAEAAAEAGVLSSTYQTWVREGAKVAQARALIAAKEVPYTPLSRRDEALWWFWQQIDQAKAYAERRMVGVVDQAATGEGLVTATVTRKVVVDEKGREREVERTVKQSQVLPNVSAAQWLLARRSPERWAGTNTLEVTGAGGAPIEHHHTIDVPVLESMIEEVRNRMQHPIDTTAAETPQLHDNEADEAVAS